MEIVIFVWASASNNSPSIRTDGTRDVITNMHFIITSTNVQVNESLVNLLYGINLSTANRKQYGQQEFMREKLKVKI